MFTKNSIMLGASYAFQGFHLIAQRGLRKFSIIPLIINCFIFIGLFFFTKHFWGELTVWIQSYLPSWLQWLHYILWLLFCISFLLISLFSFTIIANLLSAPFNTLLSEKIAHQFTHLPATPSNLLSTITDTPRMLGRQLAIIGYYLPRAFILVILFFIPLLQLIAAPLWFLFNAWFMSLQYLDYPSDNQKISLKEVRKKMQKNRWVVIGFGSMVLILSLIPIVNFLIIPAAVAGATKLWAKELM